MAEITWTVTHVLDRAEDPEPGFEPWAYSEGLLAERGIPNLYLPYVGACGHRVGTEMANFMVNEVASQLLDGETEVGGAVDAMTAANAILRLVLGDPLDVEAARRLEVYPRDPGPVIPLSWTCSLDDDWPG